MVSSESEFHDALIALVSEAAEHDTEMVGAWDIRDADGEGSGWTVEITEFVNERVDPEGREVAEKDEE